jgi:hypothetical protein
MESISNKTKSTFCKRILGFYYSKAIEKKVGISCLGRSFGNRATRDCTDLPLGTKILTSCPQVPRRRAENGWRNEN